MKHKNVIRAAAILGLCAILAGAVLPMFSAF